MSLEHASLLNLLCSNSSLRSSARRSTGDKLSDEPLTMVFCNTVASCRATEHALAEAGIDTLCYHGELNSVLRGENLRAFMENGSDCNVLVCTDMAARGLDIPSVDHVVMFDFPLNPIDYLHRAGRTARGLDDVGAKGRVTALVAKRDKVLATAIEKAVQNGEPLDALSGRKSDYDVGGRLGKAKAKPARRPKPTGEKIRGSRGAFLKGGAGGSGKKSKTRRSNNRSGGGIR